MTDRTACSSWLGGAPQMGSVSRGRPRRGGWGDTPTVDGMSTRGWLLGALLLLTLATASVARPSSKIAEKVETASEREGKE